MAQIDSYKKQQSEIEGLINRSIYSSTYELFYTGGVMIWPTYTTSYITSPFGSRLHPIQGITKNHNGIDIGGRMNDPVYAASDGVIIYYGWMSGYGNCVMVDHGMNDLGQKIVTLYGHGNGFMENLRIGSVVHQGEQIMYLGSTGNSTGPHVHFEVRENGVAVDPKRYLSTGEDQNNTEENQNTEEENNTNE
jgi:murein DD-endopeptidase MepM/ murein hydrolase activator NlpD